VFSSALLPQSRPASLFLPEGDETNVSLPKKSRSSQSVRLYRLINFSRTGHLSQRTLAAHRPSLHFPDETLLPSGENDHPPYSLSGVFLTLAGAAPLFYELFATFFSFISGRRRCPRLGKSPGLLWLLGSIPVPPILTTFDGISPLPFFFDLSLDHREVFFEVLSSLFSGFAVPFFPPWAGSFPL